MKKINISVVLLVLGTLFTLNVAHNTYDNEGEDGIGYSPSEDTVNNTDNTGGSDNGVDNTPSGNKGEADCDTAARDAEFPGKKKIYTYVNIPKIWHEADLNCKSKCMALATVMSSKEQDYLATAIQGEILYAWLNGYCSNDRNCRWKNTNVYINSHFKHWVQGDPQTAPRGEFSTKYNCVVINPQDNMWSTGKCGLKKPFVCQSFQG